MRTQRAWLCLDCLARQVRLDACVRCGGDRLVDLRTPAGRSEADHVRAAKAQARAVTSTSLRSWLDRDDTAVFEYLPIYCVVVAGAIAAGIFWVVYDDTWRQMAGGARGPLGQALAWVGVLLWPLFAVAASWIAVTRPARDEGATPARMEVADRTRAEAPAPNVATARGRVRVLDAVTAPLSGEAVAAARLHGDASGGDVDDAVCGRFEVLDAQGQVVARVEEGACAVELGTTEVVAGIEADRASLWSFLTTLGLASHDGRFLLGETALRDGDEVALEGPADEELVADGYRGRRAIPVFRGAANAPVWVRAADAPRVRVELEGEGAEGHALEAADDEAARRRG